MEYAIETRSLSKRYRGGVQALKAVSLRVKPGTCFGLLGPNGAGKSTLVKVLLSIVSPTVGSATLNGIDIAQPRARRGIGYLPEGHSFPSYLTGYGVCQYFGRLAGHRGPGLARDIEEKLDLVGLGEWGRTKITKYSKGMRQRVGLAQALVGDPKIIFLDEPTDGLDPIGRQEIREVIRRVCDQGATVFLNSHLLSEVELVCDEVGILHKGELLQQGTVAEVHASVDSAGKAGVVVRFRTAPLSEEVWTELARRGAGREPGPWFRIDVRDEEGISGVIDELRAKGVAIYEVGTVRRTLEQTFVELVSEEAPPEAKG